MSRSPSNVSDRARLNAPDWSHFPLSHDEFIELVSEQGRTLYRDLPWRNIDDAYGVLVSEVMLQQTQVSRVLRYWQRWMALFPTIDALAAADTATALEAWQGLGYNRRALALKRACEQCAAERGGSLPKTVPELVALPGIGPATAGGIIAFAYNEPAVYIETNVRTVFLHELFRGCDGIADREIAPYVADTCPADNPRAWYYALLDYGAHLKKQVTNPSRRSAHYTRQSTFSGSRREKRSFLLKQVLASPDGIDMAHLHRMLDVYEREAGRDGIDEATFEAILAELVAEGFFRQENGLLVP